MGELSIASWILLVVGAWRFSTERWLVTGLDLRLFCGLILLAGSLVYPASFGAPLADFYRFGFGNFILFGWVIPVLGGLLALAGYRVTGLWLMLSACAYGLGLLESTNAWDYLIDASAFFTAGICLFVSFFPKPVASEW